MGSVPGRGLAGWGLAGPAAGAPEAHPAASNTSETRQAEITTYLSNEALPSVVTVSGSGSGAIATVTCNDWVPL